METQSTSLEIKNTDIDILQKDSEENLQKDSEEKLLKESEENLQKESEENLQKDSEEKPQIESEDKLQIESEDKLQKDGEEKLQQESEENLPKASEDKLQIDDIGKESGGEDSDGDDCDEIELNNSFSKNYLLSAEKAITLERTYILHMNCLNQKICVGLSNYTCEVHEISESQLNKKCTLYGHSKTIINVKFSSEENLLYTGSSDGSIKLWDLRTPQKRINEFIDTTVLTKKQVKPFLSFDVSQNNRVLCAGTELYDGDSFLLFWDIRNTKLLGGYWESHMDDVTKVAFHPTDKNKLASCSTDGLINTYNLAEACEDDALTTSLNTESSVEQIMWYTRDNKDAIACVTHPVQVQLWNPEDVVPYNRFNREQLTKAIKRKSVGHCYVASVHKNKSNEDLFLLSGSNWHNGECVRGVNINENQLMPYFALHNNKQRIRTSHFDSSTEQLITGGEEGILSVWQPGTIEESGIMPLKSSDTKEKLHSKKPY